MLVSEIEVVNGQPDSKEPWLVAEDAPQIDINGEDFVVFAENGVVQWVNNERAWVEVCPNTLDALLRRIDNGSDRADIVGAVSAHWEGVDPVDYFGGEVLGHRVQHDPSGQGHRWTTVYADAYPAVVQAIEGEILENGKACGEIVVGGEHYRWL